MKLISVDRLVWDETYTKAHDKVNASSVQGGIRPHIRKHINDKIWEHSFWDIIAASLP
jgi:hypothetical protein